MDLMIPLRSLCRLWLKISGGIIKYNNSACRVSCNGLSCLRIRSTIWTFRTCRLKSDFTRVASSEILMKKTISGRNVGGRLESTRPVISRYVS